MVGAKYWNNRNHYYIQANNPTEQILKKRLDGGWLESCGPTAAVNCIAALGYPVTITTPGLYEPQPEEVVMDFFNDPRNYSKLRAIRDLDPEVWLGNQVPQYYPYMANMVFGASAKFEFFGSDGFDRMASYLFEGKSIQLCFEDPGHYIAVVAYDGEIMIYNDSWPGRLADGNGFNRELTKEEFINIKNFAVIYWRT